MFELHSTLEQLFITGSAFASFHLLMTLLFPSFYQAASSTANAELPSTHPIRLGLALNFSVFYYEIMNSPER